MEERPESTGATVDTNKSADSKADPITEMGMAKTPPALESDDEVDCRDTPVTTQPLHIVGMLEGLPPARSSASSSSASSSSSSSDAMPQTTRIRLPVPVTPRNGAARVGGKKPPLTLSAFRRPEQTVRLTDCDATRLLENEYSLRAQGCRVLGHGAFSTVRLAVRLCDGRKVAIKSLSKVDALSSRRLRRGGPRHMDEWEIMRKMQDNPHVLTLLDVFETDEEIHLVTEYCEGGELFDAIKRKGSKRSSARISRYSEAQAARITNQVLQALRGLHGNGIVHRDIKAENILLLNRDESDIQVKLADFGVARLYGDRSSSCEAPGSDGDASPQTPGLLVTTNSPPELCRKEACGPASDVYSLGVTLYILLCGSPPVFSGEAVAFPEAHWRDVSEQAKSVVREMLHPDPCRRTTVDAALADPWVRQQTTRVRRGSMSANLELVRARLHGPLKRRRSSSMGSSPLKRRRSSSIVSQKV